MQISSTDFVADVRVPIEVPAKATAKAPPQPEEVKTEVSAETPEIVKLRTELSNHGISLEFSRDETTNHLVVRMIDDKTGDAIRQFPTDVSLSLSANFMKLQGVFVDVEK